MATAAGQDRRFEPAQTGRSSVRRTTQLLATALSLGLATLASPTRAETPKDTLVVAKDIADMITADPAEIYEFTGGEVGTNVYDRIMRFEAEDLSKIVGGVVENDYKLSDDGKTYTFKVRAGQKFHSGNPLTADDIAFSLQRVIKLNLTPAFLIGQFGWTKDNVDSLVKAVDPTTFQMTITEQFAPSLVLNLLTSVVGSVVDKKVVLSHEANGDFGHAWLHDNEAGSGAFSMKTWKPNESIVMEADPDYRLGPPKLKRVVIRHVSEPASQRLLLEKGDVDMARNLTPDQSKGLAGNPDIVINTYPSADTYYMALNQNDQHLKNPKVRQAIRWLVDYQGMVDTFLKGQYIVHQSFWPSGFFASYDDNPFKLDVAKAKQLLSDAGYPNGFDIQMDTSTEQPFTDIAQNIQQSFAQAGINLKIKQQDSGQLFPIYRARQHQIVLIYWSPDYMDPHSNADSFARNPDNSDTPKIKPLAWRNHWEIPDIMAETDAAVQERDTEKRKAMYIDLQKKLQEDGPFVFLFQPTRQTAMRKNVTGYVQGPTFDVVYYRLTEKQ
jgi:peptide/nickel transport system substrate-binding protein